LKSENGKLKMKENAVREKSFAFALRVVNLAKYLEAEKREFVLSKQVLRSGTAIGALVREAEHGESKADFTHKMNIALKEANENLYWLELLYEGEYMDKPSFESIRSDSAELIKLLAAIVKTARVR
jgi:four helix bundle protein